MTNNMEEESFNNRAETPATLNAAASTLSTEGRTIEDQETIVSSTTLGSGATTGTVGGMTVIFWIGSFSVWLFTWISTVFNTRADTPATPNVSSTQDNEGETFHSPEASLEAVHPPHVVRSNSTDHGAAEEVQEEEFGAKEGAALNAGTGPTVAVTVNAHSEDVSSDDLATFIRHATTLGNEEAVRALSQSGGVAQQTFNFNYTFKNNCGNSNTTINNNGIGNEEFLKLLDAVPTREHFAAFAASYESLHRSIKTHYQLIKDLVHVVEQAGECMETLMQRIDALEQRDNASVAKEEEQEE